MDIQQKLYDMTNINDINTFYNKRIDSTNEYESNGWSRLEHNSLVNAYIKDYVGNCLKTQHVHLVDVGCGSGMLGDLLESLFDSNRFKYSGIDLNPEFVKINKSKGRDIYQKNIITDDFAPPSSHDGISICVFSGIFAVFPKDKIQEVLKRAYSWYDITMCYALDVDLCLYTEEDKHNYVFPSSLEFFNSLNATRLIKTSFPEVYHSVMVVEK